MAQTVIASGPSSPARSVTATVATSSAAPARSRPRVVPYFDFTASRAALTNAFSKRLSTHESLMHLFAVHYNFCRIHETLRVTPTTAAGVDGRLWDYGWLADLVAEVEPKPRKPGPKKGKKYRPRYST